MEIGIIGLGLIGGSLGLDLRSRGHIVLGVSRQEETCKIARKQGIVNDASVSLSLLAAADLIFICTPMAAIAPTLESLIPHLSPNTIVTDVGSVKAPIVKACSSLWHNFIGGHPMAGTAESGIAAAQSNLFVNAPYVLTPTPNTPAETIQQVKDVAQLLGSQVYICRPEEHDRAVAWISHLPVMVSAGLIHSCLQETDNNILELAQNFASSGFRDTSRVGGGNPQLGEMMAKYNRDSLLHSLHQYRQSLDQIINHIEQEDWKKLEDFLEITQQERPHFCE